jgi:hypothetical protein
MAMKGEKIFKVSKKKRFKVSPKSAKKKSNKKRLVEKRLTAFD